MPKYKVVHPIRHDGKAYGRGAVVELSAKDGERLQKFRHVEPVNGSSSTTTETSKA